ncbi:CAP domain-containing protein [Cohnella cholangitidis]|uniref:SCP-like extracellular n=1 Tax=Cohnella cholangitidis TaxID=2598458 RepID=A0A7G5C217_9BACL|nr:CAP domain-containing protein [Cohnella cholangitidis]QMV43251.1 SCP-like extracellular [Cohnella cholangitidis]
MNNHNRNSLKKTLILGTLALAVAIPTGVGAASAANKTVNTTYASINVSQLSSRLGFDLNTILQQIMQGQTPVVTKPGTTTGTGNTGNGNSTTPSKPSTGTGTGTGTGSGAGTGTAGTGTTATSAYAAQVVTIVNQERAKAGLSPLKMSNATLTKMALDKAKDMYNNGYFDHNSPTYGSPFDMMKTYGISFRYAGENIAKGQRSPQEVMTAWMNSSGHRANILSPNFTTIGVAYYNGVWVQEFIA